MISLILTYIYMDVLRVYIFVYIIPSADGALPRPWAENKVTWCMRKLQQLMSLQDLHMLEVYGTYTYTAHLH
jgi:hypothetical protein